MGAFEYHDGQLTVEGVPLARIAGEIGTPVYVYARSAFTGALAELDAAFADRRRLICYSVKTCANLSLLKLVAEGGFGADIVSGGELFKALKAGVAPGRVVFSGVGKTEREMAEALAAGIMMFNVESAAELEVLSRVAGHSGRRAPVALRVNPEVDPQTHPYIATGLKSSKFGVPHDEALDLYRKAAADPHLKVVGLDCHIGSQLTSTAPFAAAAERLRSLALELGRAGISLEYLDLGGGLGICYNDEEPPTAAAYAAALRPVLDSLPDLTVVLEPGRRVAGPSGALLVKVLYNKNNGPRRFVVVDGAMNDLLRPSLYGAYHAIRPTVKSESPETAADVVGPVCESGDFLARERLLPEVAPGDILAVMDAGAYGFSMSSNYNARPRAAEVLAENGAFRMIKPRETYDDLIRGETI
ncbi:MAG: diaminopimelate decarboxylase [Candidatus Adiutrix sp.]|jgi:diaminopimelate decarboxylase|nr:diaminopimelate decarboxylase [Candidatus Adiutrix sp.]